MPGPEVKVTFYDNFHQIDAPSAALTFKETYVDESSRANSRWRLNIQASAGFYTLSLFSKWFGMAGTELIQYTTGAIAWNASPATVAAALEAISTLASGETWEWTVVEEISPGVAILNVRSANNGIGFVLPEGSQADSTGLSGHLVWDWDEIIYHVDLTQGGCEGPKVPSGEVHPGGVRAGRRPKPDRISGGAAPSEKSPPAKSPYRPERPVTA